MTEVTYIHLKGVTNANLWVIKKGNRHWMGCLAAYAIPEIGNQVKHAYVCAYLGVDQTCLNYIDSYGLDRKHDITFASKFQPSGFHIPAHVRESFHNVTPLDYFIGLDGAADSYQVDDVERASKSSQLILNRLIKLVEDL